MSNRCKHSEYWQQQQQQKSTCVHAHTHTHTKNPVLKMWIRLSFCEVRNGGSCECGRIFYSSTRELWQPSKALSL